MHAMAKTAVFPNQKCPEQDIDVPLEVRPNAMSQVLTREERPWLQTRAKEGLDPKGLNQLSVSAAGT